MYKNKVVCCERVWIKNSAGAYGAGINAKTVGGRNGREKVRVLQVVNGRRFFAVLRG